ncbi:hypothetical protein JDV09_09670 [Mycobacterium sp. Y57]|uniref:hypothetical protein n=1 Tax=Mycolicibacterium xanthum TaxID=2796469 RepID=UPI001C84C21D|nr:hypothetical protein [Mycolicibacterium xanthum]MBX7432370.1 hypothetical protein [Mycolicibacterium xanthum]
MARTINKVIAAAGLATAVAAPGALGLAAGTANALPISNLASECRQANGGSWQVSYGYNHQVTGYMCFYKDIGGNGYVDFYDRYGNYYGSG